jgi:hypothetical protein
MVLSAGNQPRRKRRMPTIFQAVWPGGSFPWR